MAASTIAYTVEVDWDRSGTYETDITGEIERPGAGISIDRGFNDEGLYKISSVRIAVSNRSGTYSPGNTVSARYGQLNPGVPIRVVATHATVDYTRWTGYIQKFELSGGANAASICTFHCQDLAGYLAQYSPVNVDLDERTTDEAYTAIATAVGLGGSDYNFPTGKQTLPFHWVRNGDAFSAMADVLQSEMGGVWFVDALGVIQGLGRDNRLGVTADDTWGDDSSGAAIYPSSVRLSINDSDLISQAQVQPNIFTYDDPDQVIFVLSRNATNPTPDSIFLAAGERYEASIDYAMPVQTLSAQVAGTDYKANTAINGTGTDRTSSLTVTVTDEGAGFNMVLVAALDLYVTKFQLQGLALNAVPDRPTFLFGLPIAGDKTERGVQISIPFADDGHAARDFAVQLASTYHYAYPQLELTFDDGRNDATAVAMLSVELNDLVAYQDTALAAKGVYVDELWYVDGIRVELPPDTKGYGKTTVSLMPSYLYRNLDAIAWDTFERADASGGLGTSTSGDVWTNSTSWDIVSTKARPNSTSFVRAFVAVGGSGNMVVRCALSNLDSDANVQAGVQFRHVDGSNYWLAYVDADNEIVVLAKVVATTFSVVDSHAWTAAATAEIEVRAIGNRIRVYLDGVVRIDEVDSALNTATNAGLFSNNSATHLYDDFIAEAL